MRPKSIIIVLLALLALQLMTTGSARSQSFEPYQGQNSEQIPEHGGSPAALLKPENMACQGWEYDTVLLSWADKSTGEDGYKIERSDSGGAFSEIATVAPAVDGKY